MTDTEKDALERRIDELCEQVERLHADQAHWELGNCPSCPNVVSLQEALEQNAKLRELVAEMFNACPMCVNCAHNHLTVGWYDRMRSLGIEVD